MYKLYYDSVAPADQRIDFYQLREKFALYESGLWQNRSSVPALLSQIGISTAYTQDRNDGIVIHEIDSIYNKEVLFTILKFISEKYNKSLIVSTTESFNNNYDFSELNKLFPNLRFLCNGNHKITNLPSDNLYLFPFFVYRPTGSLSHLKVHNRNNIIFSQRTQKIYHIYNHLSYQWRLNKYITHFMITHYSLLYRKRRVILSYQPIELSQRPYTLDETASRLNVIYRTDKDYGRLNNDLDKFLGGINDSSKYFLDAIKLPDDKKRHDVFELYHPLHLYTDCFFSLITEVNLHKLTFSDIRIPNHFISEKTVQPIANMGMFLHTGCSGFNNYMKETLGFELFEEVFDYSHDYFEKDELCQSYKMIYNLDQLTDQHFYDNEKTIFEKITYNKDLLYNPMGSLHITLREKMKNILDDFVSWKP